MGLLKVIEWKDDSRDTIVYKYELKKDFIGKGSALTVRDGQVAIFSDKGKMADVFLPGFYKLDTNNIPILTKLMSWKYGFESPFKSDVYFLNTTQFTNQKWGTQNPITIRDQEFGAVRIKGYGTYSFKVDDAFVFMQELSSTHSTFKTDDIVDYLRSMLITGVSDAIGESKIPILDMASNLVELGEIVRRTLEADFKAIGILLVKFNFENFSMPKELEDALDRNSALGMRRGNLDVEMQLAQAEALKEAAKNPGVGTTMGAGMGLGMGAAFGSAFGNMAVNQQNQATKPTITCSHCGAKLSEGSKFCLECGKPVGNSCPKCGASVKENAKFCPECGASLKLTCKKCGAELKAGVKFCPECGEPQ